ncbi:MAG TPA: prolyl oligopeptidase family serine peptidase [Steroidobacteraceae bacterium]|nr:prolyl oligopeptidase family serine peptidase [Steroidobacteraceae bacterium]
MLLGSLTASAQPVTLTRDGVAVADPAVAASLPAYLQSRSAHFVGWLADGSMLIATRFGDTRQIHRVRAPLGMREQVSFAAGGVLDAAARPYASDAFAYLAPRGDATQLFLQQLGVNHALQPLTDGSEDDSAPVWAPDGRRIAFTSARRDGVDVYLLDIATPRALPRLLVAGNGQRWRIYDWSSDTHRLLLGRELAGTGSAGGGGIQTPATALYLADVDTGMVTPVAASAAAAAPSRQRRRSRLTDAAVTPAPVQAISARFAGDGHGILLLTRAQPAGGNAAAGQYLHLGYVDASDGQWRELSAPVSHDVELFDQSADGRYLAYTVNDDGISRLVLVDQQLKLDMPVTTLPPGVISSLQFDGSGHRLALTLETTRSPADVYAYQPQTGTLTRWTESEVGPLDTQSFAQPQRLLFSTWDHIDGQPRRLPMWVYTPGPGAPVATVRPVVIWLCSGGGGQCRPRYAPFVQYLAQELGCVVIAPNVRGSSGLGLALQQAGEGALGGDAVRDIGSLLVWIGLQPGLDRTRVAVLGEGYGSYLALASLAQYGDRLQGAVAAFPSRLAGLPNVLAIRRPVLLVQGLDDPAVPPYESAQLREGLRAQGVAVQYLAISGEGRDFARRSTLDAYHLAAAGFLARLLRN